VLQCVAVCCSVLQCVAVCCSVLQCVAVCCSVLQCVAVCCSAHSTSAYSCERYAFSNKCVRVVRYRHMSHVTRVNESCYMYDIYRQESRHTYEMSHVTLIRTHV